MSILVDRFRATVSKLKDFRMKSEAEFAVSYPTGFLNFDFMNGSVVHVKSESMDMRYYSVGIQDGSMVMIIGRSGCGKTTWAMQTAANIIRKFPTSAVFHDDIEGGIATVRKQTLTKFYDYEEFQKRYISRNTGITAENFYERIKMIHDMKLDNRDKFEKEFLDTMGEVFKNTKMKELGDYYGYKGATDITDTKIIKGKEFLNGLTKSNSVKNAFKELVSAVKLIISPFFTL